MNLITTITKTLIKAKQRIITVVGFGPADSRTGPQAAPFGIDSCPIKGMQALYIATSKKGQPVFAGYFLPAGSELPNAPVALIGETRLYSTNADGVEQARVWLHDNGNVELGGTGAAGSNTNHATQYEALKAGYDQLKSDHNDLVNAFNTHMHATAGTGPPAPPTPGAGIPAVPSTADITGSKLTKILVQ